MIYKKLNKIELIIACSTALTIFLFYLLFNFNYLSRWIDEKGDAKTYSYYVKLGIPKYLFNPHHIGFDWIGQQMYLKARANGYTGTAMTILQLRNLLISSIGLGILFFLFFKISKKYFLSLGMVMLIAFSCAFWIYSQINDTPIIHSILLALLFFAIIYFPQAKNKYLYSAFLGLFHAIIIFFHQSDVIFMAVIAFVVMFSKYFKLEDENELSNSKIDFISRKNINIQRKINIKIHNAKYFFLYLGVFFVIVVTAYYYVGIVLIGLTFNQDQAETFNQFKGSTYFFNWLILYTKINYWGRGYEGNTIQKVIHGISTYFVQPQTFQGKEVTFDPKNILSSFSILPTMIVMLFTTVLSCSLIFFRQLYKKYRYIFLANILFVVVYAVFACWWEPDYREFWVAPMFSFWILAFYVLNYIIERFTFFNPLQKIFLYSYLFLFAFLLFYFNFTGFLYPNSSTRFKKFDIINHAPQTRSIHINNNPPPVLGNEQ